MLILFSLLLALSANPCYVVLTPQAVLNTLSIGASLLLPPLRERTELLLSLLPQGPQSLTVLSKGQVFRALLCQKIAYVKNTFSHDKITSSACYDDQMSFLCVCVSIH